MKKIIDKVYDYNRRELRKIEKIVDKIESYDESTSKLTNDELKSKTIEFKERLASGEKLDNILPEAFAVVREAAFRVLGMKHYRVQLIGGVVLYQGRVAEMKTGEGKTLVATCPAYLHALTGEGVHVITTNEYLAKRDCEEMGKVYSFLGLTSGVILHEMETDERREIYNRDIIYGINSEIGFDYLRDNMVKEKSERMQRKLNYAIVDEIDSILIDEARTPLIISGQGEDPTEYYIGIDEFVKSLEKDIHFEVDEKKKTAILTEDGIAKLEKHFNIDNYADLNNIKLRHHITQSLKANYTMERDIDYIENYEGEILIVDGFTGRVMEGRRFSDGLHQAIEAKEDVDIQPENRTLATITLQNLFRMYNRLSGMSGTVVTESEEFQEIYNLDVIVIPTNKPIQRIDREDKVYTNIKDKYYAIVDEIISTNKKGQPVLVGTASIQKSEDISALLKRKGIAHNVLNAKNHALEADIVSKAGDKGAITIATNMAGRGTDIKLTDEVRALGGLKVIGSERHDSIRVDNQLRGRSGRQGDPGESIFFVSLEDEMIKNFISDKFKKILNKLENVNGYIDSTSATKAVENAQKAVEGDSSAARMNILGYDDTLNKQREVIYNQRNLVIDKEDISEDIKSIIKSVVEVTVDKVADGREDINKLIEYKLVDEEVINDINLRDKQTINSIIQTAFEKYESNREKIGVESDNLNTRMILLDNVDKLWIEYLNEIEIIRQGVDLKSFKQVDPVQLFVLESSEIFNQMTYRIKEETFKELFKSINKKDSLDELESALTEIN